MGRDLEGHFLAIDATNHHISLTKDGSSPCRPHFPAIDDATHRRISFLDYRWVVILKATSLRFDATHRHISLTKYGL